MNETGSIIDIIIILWMAFLILHGWDNGIVRILVGPISLLAGIAVSVFYFQKTHHVLGLLTGAFFAPLAIFLVVSLAVIVWHKKINRNAPPPWPSRFLGSLFNLSWGVCILMPFFVMVTLLPPQFYWFNKLKQNILHSYSYFLIDRYAKNRIPFVKEVETTMVISQDPSTVAKIQSSKEFRDLYQDERIQNVLSDKETMIQIQEKDIVRLMQNQKFLELWKDPELVKKIADLSKTIMEENLPKQPLLEETSPTNTP